MLLRDYPASQTPRRCRQSPPADGAATCCPAPAATCARSRPAPVKGRTERQTLLSAKGKQFEKQTGIAAGLLLAPVAACARSCLAQVRLAAHRL